MSSFFVEFEVNNKERFADLCRTFAELKKDKEAEKFRDENEWVEYFDDAALSHFWWPSPEELEAYQKRWDEAPVDIRLSDESYWPPSWDFLSMIVAFQNGEYDLLDCKMVSSKEA